MTLEVEQTSPAVRKVLAAPLPLRQMAARGVAPGLKPHDALAVVVILAQGNDAGLADIASQTLAKLPAPLLNGALTPELSPQVLEVVAPLFARDAAVMERMVRLPQILPSTVEEVAMRASEPVSEIIAVNEERLLSHPRIIEKLYMNESTRMSTADRILELAVRNRVELPGIPAYKEAALAILNELIPEPSNEPTPDDILFLETAALATSVRMDAEQEDTHQLDDETGAEVVRERFLPLYAQLDQLTVTQKIRRAMLGTAGERLLLVRDKNKLVAAAAVRSPKIQENEIIRISASRNVADEVLRVIALDRGWTKSHQIKINLVQNPRTPFVFAAKLIPHLREHELKALAKSKNVTGAVSNAARQQLSRKSD